MLLQSVANIRYYFYTFQMFFIKSVIIFIEGAL